MRNVILTLLVFSGFFTTSATAEMKVSGSWGWEATNSSFFAATANDSGAVFGQFCYPGEDNKCYWLVGLSSGCQTGDEYPALVNSDTGAASLRLVCMGKSKDGAYYRYAFTDFDSIDAVAKDAARVGIAVPLKGDEFRVSRFDMSGSRPAVLAMRLLAERESQVRPVRRTTRDQTL